MSDLLNNLGKKSNSVEGAGKASEPQQATASAAASTGEQHNRGDDLLAKLGGKKSQTGTAEPVTTSSAESGQSPKSASSTEEPTGSQTSSEDWTDDSKMKEIKKLREENKAYRLKYQAEIDRVARENEARVQQVQEQMKPLLEAKTELERIKAEQEDKKRDLSEKLAHRESKIAELQTAFEAQQREWQRQLQEREAMLNKFQADIQAQEQVYEQRIQEELAKVPDKYQDLAKYLVKGAEDKREALTIVQEAKLKGMFEDKTVVVNHSVPGASDGARATKERLEEAERKRRENLNSSQKIGEALKSIRSGNPNTVFRSK
jgi:chromosome segregation ATPase